MRKFSCFMIGKGSLLIQCAQIVINEGHTLLGIISADDLVKNWASKNAITCVNPSIALSLAREIPSFDYLFSIVNTDILNEQILKLPLRGSINYHDAPLPRYAGSYATSWAILNGEKKHGITWHLMTGLVDSGDILKQEVFEVTENDTAFSLNLSCYEAATKAFAALIHDLSAETALPQKQDLAKRTFFPQYQRPSSACILSWTRSTSEIDALIRALDFGIYPNPLGVAKFAINNQFFIASKAMPLRTPATAAPGHITSFTKNSMTISVADGEILLKEILTLSGEPLTISEMLNTFEIRPGYQLQEIHPSILETIDEYAKSTARYESFWVKRLSTLPTASNPLQKKVTTPASQNSYRVIPGIFIDEVDRFDKNVQSHFLIAALILYLGCKERRWHLDTWYQHEDLLLLPDILKQIFMPYVPLSIEVAPKSTIGDAICTISEQIALTKKNKTFLRDVFARYPALRPLRSAMHEENSGRPLIVESSQSINTEAQTAFESSLRFVVGESLYTYRWEYNPELIHENDVVTFEKSFSAFLKNLVIHQNKTLQELSLILL
ncbi:MAG TPA: formyltransferase family protein [Ktedonosporobacter sp.]|nr:formyltransferase family protein [Ktedonosporobacter sp.]